MLKGSNPGVCSRNNSNEVILVVDRENKRKLLICSNNNGKYAWRTLGGMVLICFQIFNFWVGVAFVVHSNLVPGARDPLVRGTEDSVSYSSVSRNVINSSGGQL